MTSNKTVRYIVSLAIIITVSTLARHYFSAKSDAAAKQKAIHETVQQIHSSTTFPQVIDKYTTATDVTEKPSAIAYHYTVHGIEESQLTEDAIKKLLVPALCANKDSRGVLDSDIQMEYNYKVENSSKSLTVLITKSDCK